MKKLLILLLFIMLPGIFINAVTIQTNGTLNIFGGYMVINSNFQNDINALTTIYGNVTVTGNTIINGTLNIKSTATGTGSYISYGTASGSGTTNAERYMTGTAGAGDFWHNCSAPVSGQNIQNFFVDALNAIPFKNSTTYGSEFYDEANGLWTYFTTTNLPDADTSTFQKGKGYLLRRTSNGSVTFTGALNAGNVSPVITRSRFGWNSVGNPYSSSIGLNTGSTITNFLSVNSLNIDPSYVAAYFWSGTGYVPVNNASAATYIQPGQGFVIKSKAGGGNIDFNSAMQAHNNSTFYKKSYTSSWDFIILTVNTSTDTANTKILFRDDMSLGLDISYDAGLFSSIGKILLYTKLVEDNGVDFAIQCLPSQESEEMVIPIGLDCPTGGQVSFNASISSLPAGYKAILEDRKSGAFTDLTIPSAKYEVSVPAGTTGTGRFFLHNSESSVNLNPKQEKITIYSGKKEIYIKGSVSSGSIASVYDLLGRKIEDFSLEPSDNNILNADALKEGIYIVRVVDKGVLKADRIYISE